MTGDTAPADTGDSQDLTSACNLRVKLPAGTEVSDSSISKSSQVSVSVQNDGFIVNELLCFISNKMDSMTQDMLIKLCADYYDKETIEAAKRLLYTSCAESDDLPRFKQRKGQHKKTADLADILTCCHELGDNLPHYVARDLSMIPPLTMDCFDLSAVVNDISVLKSELTLLKQQRQLTDCVLSEVKILRQNRAQTLLVDPCIAASQESVNTNGSPGHGDMAVVLSDGDESSLSCSSCSSEQSVPSVINDSISDPLQGTAGQVGSGDSEREAEETASKNENSMDYSGAVKLNPPSDGFNMVVYNKRWKHRNGATNTSGATQESRTKQSSHRQVIVGNGISKHSIKVAPRNNDKQSSSVFISRLAPETSAGDLSDFVNKTLKIKLKCVKLKSKYDTYSSFRMFGNDSQLQKLLNPSVWPKGAIVRQFY